MYTPNSLLNKFEKYILLLYLEILKKVYRKKQATVTIRSGTLKGYKWTFNSNTNNEYVLGSYEVEIQTYINKHLKTGAVVYDIGAHHGFYSLICGKLVGENGFIYSFEPHPKNFIILKKNISVNHFQNVFPFEYAISKNSAIVEFSDTANSQANTYIHSSPLNQDSNNKLHIQSISINTLYVEKSIRLPDFIKIDVEGAEYDVLLGAENVIRLATPVIFLSTHDNHLPGVKEKCLALLKQIGYEIKLEKAHATIAGMSEFILIYRK